MQQVLNAALDFWPTPVLLLDRTGRIDYANRSAKDLIARGPVLSSRGGRLCARRRDEIRALHEAISRVAEDGVPELLRFCGREGQLVMAVLLRPASEQGESGLVLALIGDLLSPLSAHPDWIGDLFGLTKAEARIAAGLTDGLTLNEVAARLEISVHTARGHLKRVLTKTGVQSQARLMGLVARGYGALALAGWGIKPTRGKQRTLPKTAAKTFIDTSVQSTAE